MITTIKLFIESLANKKLITAVKLSPYMDSTKYFDQFSLQINGIKSNNRIDQIGMAILHNGIDRYILIDYYQTPPMIIGAVSFSVDQYPDKFPNYISIQHLGALDNIPGTGTELMRYVLQRAKNRRTGIKLTSTRSAEDFYRKLGFELQTDLGSERFYILPPEKVIETIKRIGLPGRLLSLS